ncbi:MAG: o-succinylbenzoate synthase [Aphanizomenon flos-aquae DEX188]|nr:MAG: o-succinylbenzoate synthase [Aphanizomenon flos-aquae DEX188]
MKIEQIRLYQIKQKLPTSFTTSYGVKTDKNCLLISVHAQGLVGWGECVASEYPSYSYETVKTARHILEDFLIPTVMQCNLDNIDNLPDFSSIRGHFMAKAALENALWDLLAKSQDISLSQIIGGVKSKVEIGCSIGIQKDILTLLDKVSTRLEDGYRRIKIKIKPGSDIEPVRAIREHYPDIQLMVDANSAYTLADTPLFQELDLFNLLMIEQPLAHDDIIDHAKLQKIINTPICLDESLYSVEQAQRAIDLQAGRIVNMKVGRVGGFRNALQIHDLMHAAGWQMWCGGMFETPIGRIVNVHLAAKANFTLANDIDVYSLGSSWLQDKTFVRNQQDSTVTVPTGAGIGVDIDYETLAQHQIYQVNFEQTHYFSPQKTVTSTTKDEDNQLQKPVFLPNPAQPLPFRWFGAIHESFEQQAERIPEKLALVSQDITFTYKQLNELSNQIAHYLLEHQLEGKLVAIYAAFSPFLVVALLGILKAGAAFMVLNKDYPVTRLLRYCQLSDPKALICLEVAGELPQALQEIAPKVQIHLPQQLHQVEEILGQYSITNPDRIITPEQLAYVVFTSGSTGIPNGVVGTHSPVTHFIEWQIRTFKLNEEDRFSNLASIAHDILLRDVFTPLSLGATLYVPNPWDESSISLDLGEWMRVNKISVAHLTPPRGQLLTITNQPLPDLRYLFFGGDKLPNSLVSQLQKLTVNLSCINFYGTTETPQGMSYYIISPQKISAIVPIGQGIDDVQILLLDAHNQLVNIGEKGEIAVRTPYLCQGYLDNPILTQQRFITNPYTGNTEDRIYKTGDMGRYLPNGDVEILGRRDNQVNVRGFRIELDELEGILLEYLFVKEAVVKLIEEGEKQYLVAYVVGREGLDLSLLQVYVNERLVNRVKLNIFVRLEAFPLTVNGKIDRQSLPKPDFSKREYIPPQTETESLLVSLWEDVLQEKVGITDNFFELGGDSLMATYLVVKLAKLSDTHLLPMILFDYPTIEGLATHIDGLQTNIVTLPNNYITTSVTYAPATYAQERLIKWLGSGTNTLPYHLPGVYRLEGQLNVKALQQSLAYLVQRHAALRTRLLWKDGQLFQYIEPQMSIDFQVEQLSDKRTIGDYIIRFFDQTFDLTQEIPVKVALLQVATDEHLVLIFFHHIMVDGRAKRLLLNELSILYREFVLGKEPSLLPLSYQYIDYAYWQRHLPTTLLEQHRAYWLPRLANITDTLVLPQDYPIPAVRTFKTEQIRQILPLSLSDGLKQLSQKEHTTLFMTYLSCFYLLLYRYTGKRQLSVVTPNTVRPAAKFNGVVGDFTNYLLLQIELGEQPTTFRELLQKVRRITSDAYKYQYVPFERLASEAHPHRDFVSHPLSRIQINMITWEQPFELYELKSEQRAHEQYISTAPMGVNFFDLSFVIRTKLLSVDESEPKTYYMIQLKYQSQLFKKERINQFLADYQDLLQEVVVNSDMAIVFPG